MANRLDYHTLNWLTPQIDETLNQARTALEAFVEREDAAALEQCADALHQAWGAVSMLDLAAAGALLEEMETAARALGEGADAADPLMRALLSLPDYIGGLQQGHADTGVVLAPLVNDLRAARGAEALPEEALFQPDLSALPSAERPELPLAGRLPAEPQALARQLRPHYQSALAALLRKNDTRRNLQKLAIIADHLDRVVERPALKQVFWILSALSKALSEESGEPALPFALLRQVERWLKQLAQAGEAGPDEVALQAAARGLLFRLAKTDSGAAQVAEVREAFQLPGADELAQAQANLSGASAQLFSTVAGVLKESLARVKDTLDVFVRGGDRPLEELTQLATEVNQIGDALDVLGHEGWCGRVREQARLLIQAVERGARPDDQELMEVAGALLAVEEALDQPDGGREGRTHGVQRDLLVSVVNEAKTDLAHAKEAIVHYLSAPEDVTPVKAVPELLGQVMGSLLMLDEPSAAGFLDACRRYIRDRLLAAAEPPSGAELDSLADAVASIEYYLEALAEGWADPDSILEVTRASLEALGYPPGDVESVSLVALEVPELSDERAGADAEEITLDTEPRAPPSDALTPVFAPKAAGSTPAAAASSQEVDPEIAEVFCEEAEEELENIGRLLPQWRANPQDLGTLRDLRRSFHTLKGSGRLVGATAVGEFAWAFENMLNRVTEGTLTAQPVMFELIGQARDLLPALLAEFSAGAPHPAAAEELIAQAEAVARGERLPGGGAGKAEPEPTAPGEPAAALGADFVQAGSPEAGAAGGASPETAGFAELDLEDLGDFGGDLDLDAAFDFAGFGADGLESSPGTSLASDEAPPIALIDDLAEPGADTAAASPEPEGKVCMVDPVLLDIYSKESAGHLDEVRKFLAEARAGAQAAVTEPLVRALHTLHGSSHAAGIEPAAEVSGALEDYVKLAQAQHVLLDGAALDLLHDAVDFINDTVSLLGVPGASLPDRATIMTRVARAAARLTPPAPAPAASTAEYDPELVDIFLEEGVEILDRAESLLHRWRGALDDTKLIEGLQRELHTLKGSARMVGVGATGDLSHVLESLLAALAERRLTGSEAIVDVVQTCLDRLAQEVEHVRQGEAVMPAVELVERVEALLGGKVPDETADESSIPPAVSGGQPVVPTAQAVTAAPAPPADAAPTEPAPSTDRAPQTQPAPTGEPNPADGSGPLLAAASSGGGAVAAGESATPQEGVDDRRERARVQHEQVRVRADILDQLVNHAGEVSIYRARLEQQANASRGALGELHETIDRLRGQLRRFEIETEAQIQSRYEEAASYQDFDPLEFDRFTEMQQLSRGMLETLNDLDSLRGSLAGLTRETETLLLQQSRVNTELQEGLMRTRMVPFGTQGPRLRRIVRQTCAELGKQAELHLPGGAGELDRAVLDRMLAPIEHMLRNAVAHGLETPAERRARGKPETGRISINLNREGSDVVLELADDGTGFDLAAIRRKAIERGLMVEGAELSEEDIMQFVLESGFSTAQDISQVAGRGVGMDVVNSEIKQLGGILQIHSTPGQGTRFVVRLPLTLSVTRALMVNVGEEQFAIPLLGIETIVRVDRDEVQGYLNEPARAYEWLGDSYRFMHLGTLIGFERTAPVDERQKLPLLLVRSGEHRAALLVDGLIGSRETVVKSVGPQLSTLRGISGATILGDGSVVLILDLGVLIRLGLSSVAPVTVEAETVEKPTIMVVDDSITVRRVTQRLLERHDMQVVTAKDGVDALAVLADTIPDVMLLDIEMPRMDGYELASHMRNQERLNDVAIVMITSRTGDKHRERAMSLGVNRYMGKPYQEGELLATIDELLRERRAGGGVRAGG